MNEIVRRVSPVGLSIILMSSVLYPALGIGAPTLKEREQDRVYVTAGLGLVHQSSGTIQAYDYITFGGLARAGVRLTPQLAVELNVSSADEFLFGPTVSRRVGIGVQWMPFENLMVTGGLGYRRIATDDSGGVLGALVEGVGTAIGIGVSELICTGFTNDSCCEEGDTMCYEELRERTTIKTETTDLGLELGVGQQWHWGFFTLGIEWASVYQPIAILSQRRLATISSDSDVVESVSLGSDLKVGDLPVNIRFGTLMLGGSF